MRHAQAKHARVEVRRRKGELELSVQDDGCGFDVAAAMERAAHGTSLGLLGIQERVHLARGRLEIHSRPGQGTRLDARLPLDPDKSFVERRQHRRTE